jgi:hypothetical protein
VLWVRVMGDSSPLTEQKRAEVVAQAVAIFLGFYRR